MRISKFLFDRVLHEGLDIKVLKPEKVTTPPHKRKKPLCFGFLFVFDVASSTNQRIRGFRRGFLQAQALNDGVQQEELPRRWTGRLVDTLRVQSFQVGVEEVESLMSLEVWCEDVMYKQLDKESSTPSMMRGIYEKSSHFSFPSGVANGLVSTCMVPEKPRNSGTSKKITRSVATSLTAAGGKPLLWPGFG